jgi:hypothetical protein
MFIGLFLYLLPNSLYGQAKKKADKATFAWEYEIEKVGDMAEGFKQVKVWTYSKKAEVSVTQAQKNAVHGILFKGCVGIPALVRDINVEQEQEAFFKLFFADGGRYQKYVTLVNHGAVAPGDRLKVGKKYKMGIIVVVNVPALRKDMEEAGIVKKLGSGF